MVVQFDNVVKPMLSSTPSSRSANSISFKASNCPFTSKLSFKGESLDSQVNWPKDEGLGEVRFSNTTKEIDNPKTGEQVTRIKVGKTLTQKPFIHFKRYGQVFASIVLDKDVDPKSIQVGYQDNKGGFALKVWDAKSKTAYVLFDNGEQDPSKVNINGKFEAKVHSVPKQPSFKGISFTGTKEKLSEAELSQKISEGVVIGMFGGFGTRLVGVAYPNTKPATKLGKYTFQNNMLGIAEAAGFKKAGCSLYHGADIARQDINSANLPMEISYAQQNEKTGNLGTAGAVRHTVEHMLANEVADSLKGLDAPAAHSKLRSTFKNIDLADDIWSRIKTAKGSYDQALRNIIPDIPETRAKIFDEKIDTIPFIAVVSGDHVTNINMREFARTHLENNADFTIAVKEIDDNMKSQGGDKCPYGCAVIPDTDGGKITGFKEKPYWKQNPDRPLTEDKIYNPETDNWINTGIYILSPAALKDVPSEAAIKDAKAKAGEGAKSEGSDFGKNVIPAMLKKQGSLQAFCFNDHWVDVGNNLALQQEVSFLVDEINTHRGQTNLLPDQSFDIKDGRSAVSTKASVKELKTADKAKVLISDDAKVGKIKAEGIVYAGPGSIVPDGTYRNVWIDKLDKPLFTPKINQFV